MKNRLAMSCLVGIFSLSACGGSEAKDSAPSVNKTEANEANFSAALAPYFKKAEKVCLGFAKWPIELKESEIAEKGTPSGKAAAQMEALRSLGFVQSTDVEGGSEFVGGKYKAKSYILTDAAKPFTKETEIKNSFTGEVIKETDLCWAKQSLGKITKWEGPFNGVVTVHYTYQIDSIEDWAKKPEMLAAFEYIQTAINGANKTEMQRQLKLTNLGWEGI